MYVKFYIAVDKQALPSTITYFILSIFQSAVKNAAEKLESLLPIERPTFAVFKAKESFEPSPTKAT